MSSSPSPTRKSSPSTCSTGNSAPSRSATGAPPTGQASRGQARCQRSLGRAAARLRGCQPDPERLHDRLERQPPPRDREHGGARERHRPKGDTRSRRCCRLYDEWIAEREAEIAALLAAVPPCGAASHGTRPGGPRPDAWRAGSWRRQTRSRREPSDSRTKRCCSSNSVPTSASATSSDWSDGRLIGQRSHPTPTAAAGQRQLAAVPDRLHCWPACPSSSTAPLPHARSST